MAEEDREGPRAGAHAEVTLQVGPEDTARAMGSGEADVLATPRVLALAEEAALRAVAGALPEQQTTVGTWAEIRHRRPSRVGDEVRAVAELTEVDGTRLTYDIRVVDARGGVLASIAHRRAVVARSDF